MIGLLFLCPFQTSAAEVPNITVVSYNIQGGCSAPMDEGSYNLDKTIAELQSLNADIIFLQEVQGQSVSKGTCKKSFNKNQYSTIASELKMKSYYSQRLQILARSDFKLTDTKSVQYNAQKSSGTKRYYARGQVETSDGFKFIVYNTHAERFDPLQRIAQIKQLAADAAQETFPVIVGGDFNECSDEPFKIFGLSFNAALGSTATFTPLQPKSSKTLQDLIKSSSCKLTVSNINERLDYLFGSKTHWVLTNATVVTGAGATSDHYPITTTFQATEGAIALSGLGTPPPAAPASPPAPQPGKGNFGKECDTDADCPVGNECEQSIHPNGKEYCVCEEAAHCVEEYGGDVKEWTCSNGSNVSYELNYCLKGSTPYYPIGENPAAKNVTSDVGRAFDGAALSESEIQKLLKKPVPKIRIPGLEFSEIDIERLRGDGVDASYLYIPFLGEYIAAVYKFSVILITVLSTALLILGGLQWTLKGGGTGNEEVKKRITGSIIGLLLSLGSYTVLYLVNPNLLEFKALRVQFIAPEPYADYEELPETADFGYAQGSGPVSAEAQKTIGGLIGGPNTLTACSKEAAQNASQKLHDLKICTGPCHCGYTATRFLSYIGCGNKTLSGGANINVPSLEQQGWISAKISQENYKSLPVGLLWFPGHNGVSIGDGKLFESTPGKAFQRVAEGTSCPIEITDVPAGSGICDACSKLQGHGPASKLYFRPRDPRACHSNQGWSQGTHVKAFRLVVFPADTAPNKPPLGCCKINNKDTYFSSELFCKEFSIRWKNKAYVNLPYTWDSSITDKNLCK